MAGGTFSILRSVRGYHIYKEICSQGKFCVNKFSRLKFHEFEPFAKIVKISPREIFLPYGIYKFPRWRPFYLHSVHCIYTFLIIFFALYAIHYIGDIANSRPLYIYGDYWQYDDGIDSIAQH